MDVLAYSAFNQQVSLNQQITAKTSCLSTKCSETAALQATAAGLSAASVCWVQCIEPCLLRRPFEGQQAGYWAQIPGLTGASTGFKVCDTTTQHFNTGFCCAWVVPAGVTRARFQIWGAGGNSAQSKCCGGSPFGSTGAYASVIIPVTAGNTYTLCAGCAFQCCCFYVSSGAARIPGTASWVTGTGLCNFCANGGQGRLGNWMAAYGKNQDCKLAVITCNYSGGCFCCYGTYYCVQSCATCGQIPFVPGASYFGTTTSATAPSIVYGVRGMWPSIIWDSNHYGSQCHPPIYGFESTTNCCFCWTSGTCCGRNIGAACCNILCVPGAGGWPSIAMGGSYSVYGDMGRAGMVCVTYC